MPYLQRDLLVVPIPFSDLTQRKLRPVVVLSNDRYNRTGSDVLVAGITPQFIARDYTVSLDTPDLEVGVMKRQSVVRADKVFSIDQRNVVGRFGRVREATVERIRGEVLALLAANS
jgi:mRNA interferase MazF